MQKQFVFLTHEHNPSTKLITGIKYFDQNIKFVVRSYLLAAASD